MKLLIVTGTLLALTLTPALADVQTVDQAETARLTQEAQAAGPTSVGYFLGEAAKATDQRERAYWLKRVDSARYFADRQTARDYLSAQAKKNAEEKARLFQPEARVKLVRRVGNAVVLEVVPGPKSPDAYSLLGRVAGHHNATGYGAPRSNRWVVQRLPMDRDYEFAVTSELDTGGHEVTGPWLTVPAANVSTAEIQRREQEQADREYREREAAQARQAQEHAEAIARIRAERQAELQRQQDEADRMNAIRERERIAREEAHAKAVAELPKVAPRDLQLHLRDQGRAGMVCDISFKRGEKAPQMYLFQVNGSVLGDPPDGRYHRKRADHLYRRTVQVIRGQTNTIQVYGVTPHGNAGDPITIEVPDQLTYANGTGTLHFEDVGDGRFGYAARTFRSWGVYHVAGRFSVASQTGVLMLYEAKPGDGTGRMWVVAAHPHLSAIQIGDIRTPIRRITYRRGAGYLYSGNPTAWPSRAERQAGVRVSVERGR